MFSAKYTCLNCGEKFTIKKLFFKSENQSCPHCGSRKITKVDPAEKSSCGCGSNKKGSRFT